MYVCILMYVPCLGNTIPCLGDDVDGVRGEDICGIHGEILKEKQVISTNTCLREVHMHIFMCVHVCVYGFHREILKENQVISTSECLRSVNTFMCVHVCVYGVHGGIVKADQIMVRIHVCVCNVRICKEYAHEVHREILKAKQSIGPN
jgi:hypothetical protein